MAYDRCIPPDTKLKLYLDKNPVSAGFAELLVTFYCVAEELKPPSVKTTENKSG